MPLNIDVTQILLHMLNLVILAGGLTLILYKPVAKFLRERREYYEKLEKETAEKSAECDRLKTEYESKMREADETLRNSRAEAEREAADAATRIVDDAKAKADTIVRSAEVEAEARKTHALESAQTEIGELVLSAAQKLLGEQASPEKDSALYDEFIRRAENGSADKGEGNE